MIIVVFICLYGSFLLQIGFGSDTLVCVRLSFFRWVCRFCRTFYYWMCDQDSGCKKCYTKKFCDMGSLDC